MSSKTKKEYGTLPEIGFIRLPHVLHIFGGISKTAFYNGMKEGIYPHPVRLTARTVVWDVETLRAFVNKAREAINA